MTELMKRLMRAAQIPMPFIDQMEFDLAEAGYNGGWWAQ